MITLKELEEQIWKLEVRFDAVHEFLSGLIDRCEKREPAPPTAQPKPAGIVKAIDLIWDAIEHQTVEWTCNDIAGWIERNHPKRFAQFGRVTISGALCRLKDKVRISPTGKKRDGSMLYAVVGSAPSKQEKDYQNFRNSLDLPTESTQE